MPNHIVNHNNFVFIDLRLDVTMHTLKNNYKRSSEKVTNINLSVGLSIFSQIHNNQMSEVSFCILPKLSSFLLENTWRFNYTQRLYP